MESKTPRLDEYFDSVPAHELGGHCGNIFFHLGRDIAALEARHVEEIARAKREAYEEAADLVAGLGYTYGQTALQSMLREKAGKL